MKNLYKLGFRFQRFNRFSLAVLLNILEKSKLDREFHVCLLENFEQLKSFIKNEPSGLLLYSFMTPHLLQIQKEISWINKNIKAGLKLFAGGPHSSGDPLSVVKLGFDYVYVGPAETGFDCFLQKYLEKNIPASSILYAPNLSTIDFSYPYTKYLHISPPLEITRGCFWNCKFCQTSCENTKHRSFESFKMYYQILKERNHHKRISFICPSAFEYGAKSAGRPNYEAIRSLLEYCKQNGSGFIEFGIFPSETRPNTFKKEFVDLIVKFCNNRKITLGAQSGSDRILKLTRRGHSVGEIESACEISRCSNLRPLIDFIVGFPDENSADRYHTLRLIKKLAIKYQARIQVHYFLPLAGTPLSGDLPTPLDYRTLDTLDQYEQDGICTGWWKAGLQLSRKLQNVRNKLNEKEVVVQEMYL